MKEELEQKLIQKYPNLFQDANKSPQETCMCWGICVGDGWYNLMEKMCEKLKDYPVVFDQIKEKFAGLRVYYHYSADVTTEDCKKVTDIVGEAEEEADNTCEACGVCNYEADDHQVKVRGKGWLYTSCKKCAKEGDK